MVFPSILFSREYHPVKENSGRRPLNENASGDSTGLNSLERQNQNDDDDNTSVFGELPETNNNHCGSLCTLFKEPVIIITFRFLYSVC